MTEDRWRRLDIGEVDVVGAADVKLSEDRVTFHRLPIDLSPQFDLMTKFVESATSGVRLRFASDTKRLRIIGRPTRASFFGLDHFPGDPTIDLVADGAVVASAVPATGGLRVVIDASDLATLEMTDEGPAAFLFHDLGDRPKALEAWLPTGNFSLRSIEVDADATVDVAPPDLRPRWVHHGSSISHGMEARSPTTTWPCVAASCADLHVTNLGLGGSCHVDQFAARFIAGLPADVITLKLGINLVNRASMTLRTFVPAVHGFLDTIRDRQPDTPIVVVSPIVCPTAEDVPGPTQPDTEIRRYTARGDPDDPVALTLVRIRDALRVAVEHRRWSDPAVHYLDGLRLFGPDDADDLPDGLHPHGDGYVRIGERFADLVFGSDGLVPASSLAA